MNTETNELRIEIVTNRNQKTLKTIIENHIGIGNYIISDSWKGYNFLNAPNSGYIIYINIQKVILEEGSIQKTFIKLYAQITLCREIECRGTIAKLNCNEKFENLAILLSRVGINSDDSYLSEKELISFNYDTQFDD